mgnify:CR=1 FL=1
MAIEVIHKGGEALIRLDNNKKDQSRYKVYTAFIGVLALVIVARLFWMQIICGDDYMLQAEQKQLRSVTVAAPRGEIVDRYGQPLVTNKTGYSVQIQKTNLKNDEFNAILLKLYNLIEAHGEEVLQTFPIAGNPLRFTFADEVGVSEGQDAAQAERRWKKAQEFNEAMTAQEAFEKFRKRYKVAAEYSEADALKIVALRYEMETRDFSVSTPFTVASDVDMKLVTKLKEEQAEYPCVNITTEYFRQYAQGNLAAHLLGRIGKISPEEYSSLKGQGYRMTDEVGKQGIEKEFESFLKGTDGYTSLAQTPNGFEVQPDSGRDPVPGNYVVLTLDAKLQAVLEQSLGETIEAIRSRGGAPSAKSGGDAYCGAAVVMNPKNAEVLAMASWPTFDPARFNEDYRMLESDPNKPIWNRAIGGTYAPGSTFKMLTSIAALESGVITPQTIIKDEGIYKAYDDYQPKCWIYTKSGRTHGNQTVTDAVKNSCNYFYYEVADQMGIETLDEYAKKFGFGERTGFELASEEAKGRLAGPEDRKAYGGEQWRPGDTLQAAIGQSDHLFTPIQLANYLSTLINGGNRYKPHIVKTVRSTADGSIVQEKQPELVDTMNLQQENINAILDGMLGVTEDGTASSHFKGYPIEVGGKTGSAQVAVGSDNGLFVGYAPFDDPEIAIAVVIEHGNSGGDVVPVVKAVLDEYFNNHGETQNDINHQTGTLLP